MTNGKYAPLFQHLAALRECRWRATFAEIESVLGFSLPQSARVHRAWWENRHRDHTQARSWLAAGWQTSAVNLQAETLVFKRLNPGAAAASYPRHRPRPPAPQAHARGTPEITFVAGGGTVTLGGQAFEHFARITPKQKLDGEPFEQTPHARYAGAKSTPLNPHGKGPFCWFVVPGLPAAPGVYAVTVARKLVYLGIAINLAGRWGPRGYAQIQPQNCFKGGQSADCCKVNHAILLAARDKLAVDLWIHRTGNPSPLEARLIAELAPLWNAQP